MGVHVPHLSGKRLFLNGNHLVARGKNGHPGTPDDRHAHLTERSQQSRLLRAQTTPGRNEHMPRRGIFIVFENMIARSLRAHKLDQIFSGRTGIFHHDHAVGSLRQHAARQDAGGLPRLERKLGCTPHGAVSHAFQKRRRTFLSAEHIPGPHGITVHRGAVEARQIFGSGPVMGKIAAGTLIQRNALLRQLFKCSDEGQNLVHGFQGKKGLHDGSRVNGMILLRSITF